MTDPLKGTLQTILVVDDDATVLKVVATFLERANFRVLRADSGAMALEMAEATRDEIHLLLSDIDMPLMSGPDLGQELKKTRPDIHVMLMSGGAGESPLILDYGWSFIQKPFVGAALVKMINDVLNEPNRAPALRFAQERRSQR